MKNHTTTSSNAFVSTFTIQPHQPGILDNLTFAVKDNIDIAGFKTSNGSKPWLETHSPAKNTATCVEQLLNNGACCIGKTITDELTCSLEGESYFYGTPLNPKAPDRIPGGSSSGSASAVACGLVDFAIGTDSAGSTRVPASHCGILGFRPSLHRISENGVIPFSPSTSTIGIFANELTVLEKVSAVLLNSKKFPEQAIHTIYILEDIFALADKNVSTKIREKLIPLKTTAVTLSDIIGEPTSLDFWSTDIFGAIQNIEIWQSLGGWIEKNQPDMNPVIKEFMYYCKQLDPSTLDKAVLLREKMFTRVQNFMKPGDLFCFPTVPMIAPLKGELQNPDKLSDYYDRTMKVTSFSGIARLPEISIPVVHRGNAPLGLSFAAAHNQDEFLLSAVRTLL